MFFKGAEGMGPGPGEAWFLPEQPPTTAGLCWTLQPPVRQWGRATAKTLATSVPVV